MKKFSMLIAAALAAASFAAGAADKAPIQLSESQMGQVVAGATPDVTGAGLCTSFLARTNNDKFGGNEYAIGGNPSFEGNGGPQMEHRGFGHVGWNPDLCMQPR
ncbi:MAG: hypothetical protein RLZZ555_1597 [Pseudomonadota bacterium]|jgi:hypothetical protein